MKLSTHFNTIRHFCQRQSGIALAIAAVSLMTACASATGPQFSDIVKPVADQGDVYLYRTESFAAGGDAFTVKLNDKEIDPLANGSFQHLRLAPGSYALTVKPSGLAKTSAVTMDVQAGKTLFYRYEFPTGLLMNIAFIGSSIEIKDEATALADLKTLKAMK